MMQSVHGYVLSFHPPAGITRWRVCIPLNTGAPVHTPEVIPHHLQPTCTSFTHFYRFHVGLFFFCMHFCHSHKHILNMFCIVDTSNILSRSKALYSNALIFPDQNYFTIPFGRPWACREIIWLLLSDGISRVERLGVFYVGCEIQVQCLMDTSWKDVIYSRASCCANDEYTKTREVPLQTRKWLTATCCIILISYYTSCVFSRTFFSPFFPRIVWNHCYLTIDVELCICKIYKNE